jgi:hypothetical protein
MFLKRLLLAVLAVCCVCKCKDGKCEVPAVREQSFTAVGTATTVSVSTSAWTLVPAASTLTGRTDVCFDEPATNNANMSATISTSSVVPGEATSVRPIEIIKGEQDRCVSVGDSLKLYVLSLHTAAENIHVQERRR